MNKALLDTSTYIDVGRAPKHRSEPWASNTLSHRMAYLAEHGQVTISAFTVFKHLDGLHGKKADAEANTFLEEVVPRMDVIYPDQEVFAIAARIQAKLRGSGIGLVDAFIAATALSRNLTLVNANTRQFVRAKDAGYDLLLEN